MPEYIEVRLQKEIFDALIVAGAMDADTPRTAYSDVVASMLAVFSVVLDIARTSPFAPLATSMHKATGIVEQNMGKNARKLQ